MSSTEYLGVLQQKSEDSLREVKQAEEVPSVAKINGKTEGVTRGVHDHFQIFSNRFWMVSALRSLLKKKFGGIIMVIVVCAVVIVLVIIAVVVATLCRLYCWWTIGKWTTGGQMIG